MLKKKANKKNHLQQTTKSRTLIICLSHLFLTDSYWNKFCRCGEISWRLGFCAPPSLQNQVSWPVWTQGPHLPWEQWENSLAATAHCLGALLLQKFFLLGCPVVHGWLLKVREVVLHVWKMQHSSWSWGKCNWESVPLLVTEGASLPGVTWWWKAQYIPRSVWIPNS